jgi:DNA invertase Pin-like site-specific DNA recombinase
MPDADPFRLHIEAAINEDEARKCSLRTRAALAAAKARGVKLGGFRGRHLTPAERTRGSAAANAERATQARVRALELIPHIEAARAAGAATPSVIARALNTQGVRTRAGTAWQAVQVARVLARVA